MWLTRWKNKLVEYIKEVLQPKHTPHSIALGFAIGTFIGILPLPGIHLLLAALIALTYKKVNKLAIFIGIFFWNPITLPVIYYLSYKIGDLLFASTPVVDYEFSFLEQIYHITRRFLLGNVILAVGASIISYFLVRKGVQEYQQKNQEQPEIKMPEIKV